MTASTLPPLSVWPCDPPWRVGKPKGAQTAIGPSQSPSRSLETARSVGRASTLGRRFSGSQTDLLTPWYDWRAEIIPFQYLPVLLGRKGTSHVGWDTGDLPSNGKKLRAPNPTRPHVVPTADRLRRLSTPSSRRGATLSEEGPGVARFRHVVLSSCRSACGACTELPQPRVHLCQPTM